MRNTVIIGDNTIKVLLPKLKEVSEVELINDNFIHLAHLLHTNIYRIYGEISFRLDQKDIKFFCKDVNESYLQAKLRYEYSNEDIKVSVIDDEDTHDRCFITGIDFSNWRKECKY